MVEILCSCCHGYTGIFLVLEDANVSKWVLCRMCRDTPHSH